MRRAAAFAAALLAAAPAAAEPYTAVYDLYLGGFRAAEIDLTVRAEGGAYEADATLTARGLVGAFLSAQATAEAAGRAQPGGATPERFDADARFGRDRYRIAMRWSGNPGLTVEADPPLRKRPYDAPPEALKGALDPLSAAAIALPPRPAAEACGRTIPVFDTRRRFDVTLDEGRVDGDTLVCDGRYVRVAGYKTITPENEAHPFTVWWRLRDGAAHFERLRTPTRFGYAVAVRRAAP
jgi:hypothetical protein